MTGGATSNHRFHWASSGDALPSGTFVALIDGARAPLLPLDLPPGLKGQAREKVARRYIADTLGTIGESAEITPFSRKPHSAAWTRALVISDTDMSRWRDTFSTAGKRCQAVLPDYLALPAAPDVWVIEVAGPVTRARIGLSDGFSAETALAVEMLRKAETPKAVLRIGAADTSLDNFLAGTEVPVFDGIKSLAEKGFAPPQILAHGELGFDLRRNLAAVYEAMHTSLSALRAPAVLAALGFGLWAASTMLTTTDLRDQARDIRTATVQQVREVFVPTGPLLDIRTQVSQVLAEQQTRANPVADAPAPLALVKTAGQVVSTLDAQVQTVAYALGSDVQMGLNLADFAALDRLVEALETSGIAVNIAQSSAADSGGVDAVLSLSSKSGEARP